MAVQFDPANPLAPPPTEPEAPVETGRPSVDGRATSADGLADPRLHTGNAGEAPPTEAPPPEGEAPPPAETPAGEVAAPESGLGDIGADILAASEQFGTEHPTGQPVGDSAAPLPQASVDEGALEADLNQNLAEGDDAVEQKFVQNPIQQADTTADEMARARADAEQGAEGEEKYQRYVDLSMSQEGELLARAKTLEKKAATFPANSPQYTKYNSMAGDLRGAAQRLNNARANQQDAAMSGNAQTYKKLTAAPTPKPATPAEAEALRQRVAKQGGELRVGPDGMVFTAKGNLTRPGTPAPSSQTGTSAGSQPGMPAGTQARQPVLPGQLADANTGDPSNQTSQDLAASSTPDPYAPDPQVRVAQATVTAQVSPEVREERARRYQATRDQVKIKEAKAGMLETEAELADFEKTGQKGLAEGARSVLALRQETYRHSQRQGYEALIGANQAPAGVIYYTGGLSRPLSEGAVSPRAEEIYATDPSSLEGQQLADQRFALFGQKEQKGIYGFISPYWNPSSPTAREEAGVLEGRDLHRRDLANTRLG